MFFRNFIKNKKLIARLSALKRGDKIRVQCMGHIWEAEVENNLPEEKKILLNVPLLDNDQKVVHSLTVCDYENKLFPTGHYLKDFLLLNPMVTISTNL